MMIKYKVREVAADFGLSAKEVSAILKQYGTEPKSGMTSLQEDELDIIFDYLTQKNAVESFDAYFAVGEEKRKAEEEKKAAEKAAAIARQQELADQLRAAAGSKTAPKQNEGGEKAFAPKPKPKKEPGAQPKLSLIHISEPTRP